MSVFLEVPSNNALIKLTRHISLTRDPTVASAISVSAALVDANLKVKSLMHNATRFSSKLKAVYGIIKKASGTIAYKEYN